VIAFSCVLAFDAASGATAKGLMHARNSSAMHTDCTDSSHVAERHWLV
jgi:hypothetical protein